MSARCTSRTTLLVLLALEMLGCGGRGKPEIAVGLDICRECQMVIDQPRYAAGYFEGGEFVTFDSPVCLLHGYEALERRSAALPDSIFFAVDDAGTMQPAGTTTFLLTEHRSTPMGGGVLAFADPAAAEAASTSADEATTDWPGLRLALGRPDRVIEVRFGPEGMSPEVVDAARGELVQWTARSSGRADDLVVSVLGYPELPPVVVPASGDAVVFRMRAEHPGDGFPIVAAGVQAPLGMLKVSGPHTADEEAR